MSLSSSLLVTLAYADIFRYPYTYDELVGWIPKNRWKEKDIQRQIRYLIKKKKISYRAPFYTLYGHTHTIQIRLRRKHYAREKMKKAEHASHILRLIPTISFIGITGGLALHNTEQNDDIDLFVCTKNNTLWITRFLAILLLELCGIRRRPETKNVKDAVCLNMFVTEKALVIPYTERDMYVAHEVLQMRVVWERRHAYGQFLKSNAWVKSIFRHTWLEMVQQYKKHHSGCSAHEAHPFVIRFLALFEKSAKRIQLWYMEKRRTTEVVSDTVVRFHPHDARVWIRSTLQIKLKRYHLPLDKNFFHP